MRAGHAVVALAWLVGTALGGPLAADELREQIRQAERYYDGDDLLAALTELEFAASTLRRQLSDRFAATLPEPPRGWSAEAARLDPAVAVFGSGTMISRSYRQQGGAAVIEAQLIVDSPLIQAYAALLSNPALIAVQPQTERVRIARESALLKWQAGEGEIAISLGGRVLAKLAGQGLQSKQQLVDLMRGWDMHGIKALAGI